MEELITRVSTAAGVEPEVAQQAIAAILGFLQKEGPESVSSLLAQLPGGQAAADSADAPAFGGLMGLASQLMELGLGMGQLPAAGKEIFDYAREKVGDDQIREIASAIPGLAQFI
jgi:hypothetical protein